MNHMITVVTLALAVVSLDAVSVRAADRWEKPLVAGAKIAPEELIQISKDASVVSSKAVAQMQVNVANLLSSEGQVKPCPTCDGKDYSESCPLGWTESAEGSCVAPTTYNGLCNKSQSFLGSSVNEKIEAELQCEICWPCAASDNAAATCNRNWALPCPNGFSPQDIKYNEYKDASGITCSADFYDFYEGQCEQQVTFSDRDSKALFASRCKTSWPCYRPCQKYGGPCPVDWTFIGDGLCTAPDSYKVSECALLVNFLGWTDSMKRSFAQKCAVEWPCQEEKDSPDGLACSLDLSSCPRFWSQTEDGQCTAPPDSQGECARHTDTRKMSDEQKVLWASECGLSWPCETAESEIKNEPRVSNRVTADRSGPVDSSGSVVGM